MASTASLSDNLAKIAELTRDLKGGCELVVLPENCCCLGRSQSIRQIACLQEQMRLRLAPLVTSLGVPILFGGVPVREDGVIYNSSLLIAPDGTLLARYDKIHLFQLNPQAASKIDETTLYAPGTTPCALDLNGWRISLGICFDLRFPELFRATVPSDLILCTAAFTRATGQAHWEILLRARAIENQCFMAGVGQCGTNPETGVCLHGHSLVAGPWGELVTEMPADREGVRIVALEKQAICEVRKKLPAGGAPALHSP
jgi:nitrilase